MSRQTESEPRNESSSASSSSEWTELDLAIIGGGPSGLAATAYALHAQLNVALIAPDLGGKVSFPFALRDVPKRDTVWGASLVHEFEEIVRANLGRHLPTTVLSILPQENGAFDLKLENGSYVRTRAVILSTGARAQRLFVPGEMEYWGKGVSYSAISHSPFFAVKKVAVIGSGSRAVNAVMVLTQLSSQVYWIVGNSGNPEHSSAWELAVRHPKVLVFNNWEVQQIVGDDYVDHLVLVGANGEIREIEVEGVFVQFGLLPNNALVRDAAALDEEGHIIIDALNNTSVPGIFAAGDVSSVHVEQVPVSLGEGAKAAISAWKYLAARND